MKVALVHDWLNGMRGGEKVLEALLEIYPQADIFTLFHESGTVSHSIESHMIRTSWLNRIPGVYRHYRNLLPLFPSAAESLDAGAYDLVISSSHAVAKGIHTGKATHICYCHTPMRYIWDAENDYTFRGIKKHAMRAVRGQLRRWDCESSARVHHFIANSSFVRQRIQAYYGRDAQVIHPPIDTDFFTPSDGNERSDFYLAVGALVPYKRFDLLVKALNQMGRRLVIAGTGPELHTLRKIAHENVEIHGWVGNEELRRLYRSAKAMVFAAREDFGMTMAEARSCGCPVVAFGAGGGPEIIQDGMNGILFAEQHVDDIVRAILRFESMSWPVEQVRHCVETYSRETFKSKIRKFIGDRIDDRSEECAGILQPA